jgi:ribosomal protein L34E
MRNTPNKEYRLRSATEWLKTYSGKDLVKGYSKKYMVDKICAVQELRLIGVNISEDYEI